MSVADSSPTHDGESRRRPDPPEAAHKRREKLERRYYHTYLSRLEMGKRIQRRGLLWNGALVAVSAAAAVSSIVLLRFPAAYAGDGELLLAIIGVFTLTASLVVANANYSVRARDAFGAYRSIQRLSARVESSVNAANLDGELDEIDSEYQLILDNSENHSAADYFRAVPGKLEIKSHVCDDKNRHRHVRALVLARELLVKGASSSATILPTLLIVVATLLVVPPLLAALHG